MTIIGQIKPLFTKIDLEITIIEKKYEIMFLQLFDLTIALKKILPHTIDLTIALKSWLKK